MATTSRKNSTTKERAREVGARQPEDFRKAEATGDGLVEVTVQGITIEVDRNAVGGDYEVIEALASLSDGTGGPMEIVKVCNAVLGDSVGDVKDYLRDENGRVTPDAIGAFLNDVFEALNAGN